MMKKTVIFICCICTGVLAGCEKTPEELIVREKGAQSIREFESTEEIKSSLRESLNVPDQYSNQSVYEDGRLVIDTDAKIELPDTDTISTYTVTAKEVNQDLIDHVTNVFFPDARFYHSEYLNMTKEECRQKITELKKYRAEGNLDPYHYGTNETGDFFFDIDERIAQYEEAIPYAPEEKPKEEIVPSFGLTYLSDTEDELEETVGGDYFYGAAESADGLFTYGFNRIGPGIEFDITRIQKEGQKEAAYWITGDELMDTAEESDHLWTEEEIRRFVTIPLEEARQTAAEQASRLGMDFAVYGWDYALYYRGNDGIRESNVLDGGYLFYFSRMVDGIPLTYTSEDGGVYEGDIGEEPTFESWKYERCNILVGSDGICTVELKNPYEVKELQTKNVKLMDFDSILRIYEQMMEISNADLAADEIVRTYHIRRITLGYSRIYDPTVDNATGLLVPVWDFFGEFDVEGDGYQIRNSGERSTRSFLTINAIDGTIISRELGY